MGITYKNDSIVYSSDGATLSVNVKTGAIKAIDAQGNVAQTCATWASAAASIAWHGCSSARGRARRLGTAAGRAVAAASSRWSRRIICSAGSSSPSQINPG